MKMAVVMTKVGCPKELVQFWNGKQFFQSSVNGGIFDSVTLAKYLNLKYIKDAEMFDGDFCLLPLRRK